MKKNPCIEFLLESPAYADALSDLCSSLLRDTSAAPTEATVGAVLEKNLFSFLKRFFGHDTHFDKEVGASYLRYKFKGRMDAVSNHLVFEYKLRGKLDTPKEQEHAINQTISYLKQLKNGSGTEFQAVLTDGQKLCTFYYIDAEIHHTPLHGITARDLDFLIRALLDVDKKSFVPQNILQDFRFHAADSPGPQKTPVHQLALCLFHGLEDTMCSGTLLLFQEWEALFHLSENDKGKNQDIQKRRDALSRIFGLDMIDNVMEYKALFALQTTYAILVKLIACKVLSKFPFGDDIFYFSDFTQTDPERLRAFMEMMENGFGLSSGGIRNLLEGDSFSWYCAKDQWRHWKNDEYKILLQIILAVDGYTSASICQGRSATDIFKDLYMEIMPNEVRHSLGEYFTPSWLADYVAQRAVSMAGSEEWQAIDPCCGSGVFLFSLIRQIIGEADTASLDKDERTVLLKKILSRVHGIDINPLNVLTARVGYLLAIAPLIGGTDIEIPVYLGDSANLPSQIELEGVPCYSHQILTRSEAIPAILPCSLVDSPHFLEQMDLVRSAIKSGRAYLVYRSFTERIPPAELNGTVREALHTLSHQLIQLSLLNQSGIWTRILSNFMMVARIKQMDIIIGNPPWVKWEFLPQNYAKNIKAQCIDRRLFSGQTYMGAISLNICALIANVTASAWLKENGVLAFLMPKTLMTQDSYAGFRRFYVDTATEDRLYLQCIDDWSGTGDPFGCTTEKFLTYYYQYQKADYAAGLPITRLSKKKTAAAQLLASCHSHKEAAPYLSMQTGLACQMDEARTGFTLFNALDPDRVKLIQQIIGPCAYKARSGVEFTPAEVYFLEDAEPAGREGRCYFKHATPRGSVHKSAQRGKFEAETTYIRPVIKGPNIESWHMKDSRQYCIFPYEAPGTTCVPLDVLCRKDNSPYLSKYLLDSRELIEKQSLRSRLISRGDEFYALSKVGPYTFTKHAVAFRDNTKFVSAVVNPVRTPWGESVMPVCAKHAPYISMDQSGRAITEEEAYYICGILNTSIVRAYIQFTFSSRSFSIDFNFKLPLFDSKNTKHVRIAALSRLAHEGDLTEVSEIETLYLSICAEN